MSQHSVTHTFKRVLSVILMMAVLLMMTPVWGVSSNYADIVPISAVPSPKLFTGKEVGEGTSEDPYIISTAEQLKMLADDVNSGESFEHTYFKLKPAENGNAIDLAALDGDGWTPIGNKSDQGSVESHPFKGEFDGDGFEIKGLNIDKSDLDYQGLFGYNAGTIKNVTVSGSITGGQYVGGIAGYNEGTVEYCKNKAKIIGTNNVGGIVGYNSGSDGMVHGCLNSASATVSGNISVGGIIGKNDAFGGVVTIQGCINEGEVSGVNNDVGGIVGSLASGGPITIQGCVNNAKVTGEAANVGGIVGNIIANNDSTVENCHNTGDISGGGDCVGGIVGCNNAVGSKSTVKNCYNTNNVTGLKNVGGIVGMNSSGSGGASGGEVVVESSYNEGKVSGIGEGAGGVVGYNNPNGTSAKATITQCFNKGDVENNLKSSSDSNYAGGVVGRNECGNGGGNITVTTCFNTGAVTGENIVGASYFGGVLGNNSGGSGTGSAIIKFCYNKGTVEVKASGKTSKIGGIVGDNQKNVENCYNTGVVSGINYAGGIVGDNSSTKSSLINCYNIGEVKSTDTVAADRVGGVAGRDSGNVQACFFLDTAAKGIGTDRPAADTTQLNTDGFAQDANFTGKNWDFNNERVWDMGENLPLDVTKRPILKDNPEPDTGLGIEECNHSSFGNLGKNAWTGFVFDEHMGICSTCGELQHGDHKWTNNICTDCGKTRAGTTNDNPSNPGDDSGDGDDGGDSSNSGNSGDGDSGNSGNSGSGDNSNDKSDPSEGDDPSEDGEYDVSAGTECGDGAPNVTITDETADSLGKEVVEEHLTDEEKEELAKGVELKIILRIDALGENVPDEDRQATEDKLIGTKYTVGMYLNVDLLKVIKGRIVGKITELNTPMHVTFEVPEDLREENRTFVIVRMHDGKADILEDLDGDDPDKITVLTDKFSTYTIAYEDAAEEPESEPQNNEADNPYTGVPVTVIVLTVAVSAAAVTFGKKKNIIE